jgi:hypothetical protein
MIRETTMLQDLWLTSLLVHPRDLSNFLLELKPEPLKSTFAVNAK